MEKNKILTLVGGIGHDSINKKLFRGILDLDLDEFQFESVDISKFPFFSQDLEQDPPDIITGYKEKILEAKAILFITPEYNRSLPGVLKNAIDWGSRPYGQNLWDKKPAAILGASIGNIGTFGAQHHLRQILAYLNMFVLGQPEFYFNASGAFDEGGKLKNDKTKVLLNKFFGSFEEFIQTVSNPQFNISGRTQKESLNHDTRSH